jgi:hypothetical protein
MILDRYDPIAAAIQGGISEERPDWYDNFSAAQEDFMRVDSTMSRRFGLQGVWSDITSRLNEELGDRYMRLGSDAGGQFRIRPSISARPTAWAMAMLDTHTKQRGLWIRCCSLSWIIPAQFPRTFSPDEHASDRGSDARRGVGFPRKPDADHRAIPRHRWFCALHGWPVGWHV